MAEAHIAGHIDRTIHLIKKHPDVRDVRIVDSQREGGFILVAVDLAVELPSTSFARGDSLNGVRSIERAIFCFSKEYPVRAPAIALREDFDRSLPHIMPGSPTGPVIPCIHDGDLSELLQRGGIWAILDHLCAWLDKAATNALIDSMQGWEPIRRDELRDCLVARASDLQRYGSSNAPPFRAFYRLHFVLFPIARCIAQAAVFLWDN